MGAPLRLACCLVMSVGCGRLQFQERSVGDAADAPADGGPPCDVTAAFGAPKPITELNDAVLPEGTLRLMPDERSGYFWRRDVSNHGDLYYAERTSVGAPFSVRAVQGVTSTFSALDPTSTSDGALLVFRRSGPGNDLFVATQAGAPDSFTNVTSIAVINTTSDETQPFMPLDRDELYFQSLRSGGGDIYFSTRTGAAFSAPTLVAGIATTSDEGDPVVSSDGLTMYFRSNRAAVIGGYNIYVATRAATIDPFGNVQLVPNVNTAADDGASWISPDDCRLYISSDVAGSNDIYAATRGVP